MDVDINKIEESIKVIEAKSDRSYFDMFQKASNGKIILKSDLDGYEKLLQNLSIAQKYVEYRRENESVINGYLRLQEQINTMNMPIQDNKSNEQPVEKTQVVSSEEDTLKDSEIEKPLEEEKVEESLKTDISNEEEIAAPVIPLEDAVITDEAKSTIVDPAANLGVFADKYIDDEYSYRLKKNEIIQDMAINDKSEQVFKTPGMTDEEIKNSQELLNATGMPVESPIISGENTYKAMTSEEVQNSQDKLENVPPITEKYPLPPDEGLANTPNQEIEEVGVRHKVAKKENYNWKTPISKKFAFLKGLVFIENDKSKEYLEICAKIANFRAKYKTRDAVENNIEFGQIEGIITNSTTLSENEKKRLYQKLTRLGKTLEIFNHHNQEQLEQNADSLFDVEEPATVLG